MKKFTLALIALLSMAYVAEAQQYVSTGPANKNVVIEDFTGRGCGYCPIAHRVTHEIMTSNPDKVWTVAIHSAGGLSPTSYPNLNTTTSSIYANAFPYSGIPAGLFNRNSSSAVGINESGSTWVSYVNQQLSQAAECNVAGVARINPETRVASITAEVYYTGNSTVNENYLTIVMIQDSILGAQSDYGNYNPGGWIGNQYVHMHVFRDVITSTWGDAISPTTQGTLITKNYEYTIPESIGSPNGVAVDLDQINFIVFVSERYQGTPTRPILNANELDKIYLTNDPIHPYVRNLEQTDKASCNNLREFEYEVLNMGLEDITSMKYTVQIGDVMNEFEWNGNIASGDIATMRFEMEFDFGTYEATYTITEVNGQAYSTSTKFDAECLQWSETEVEGDVTTLKVFIIQDQYGEQTTWDILNSAGEVIASGGPYSHLTASGTNPNTLTLNDVPSDDCYLFRIFDSNNDGICCTFGNGQYYIKDANNVKIVEGDGDFGSKASKPFRINKRPDAVADNAVNNMKVYPNPANSKIFVEGDNVEMVEVYNSLGQKMLTVEGASGTTSVDVASFENGVYVVRVVATDGVTTQKVSIAR